MKKKQPYKITLTVFALLLSFLYPSMAQKGGGEKDNITIWKMQVSSVASTYSLSEKETSKLSNAYVNMRMNVVEQNKEANKKTDPEEYEVNAKRNETLGQKQIKRSIDKIFMEKQAGEVLTLLGSFNARWDSYQKVLIDLNLNEDELSASSMMLVEYMKNYLLARKIAADSGERFSGRTASELKAKLDQALSENLDQAKLTEWEIATQRKTKSK